MRGLFCCTVLSYEGINLSEVQEEVGASLSYVAYKCMGECNGISQFLWNWSVVPFFEDTEGLLCV